jgi:hypothetical protein
MICCGREPARTRGPSLFLGLVAIWGATVAGALPAIAGVRFVSGRPLHDALTATPGTALELMGHNAPVVLWPLALTAIGWPALPGIRLLGDLLVTAQLAGHGLLVGAHLAEQPGLWRYLPHLPLEWLAIAAPAGAWLDARTRHGVRTDDHSLALLLALSLTALLTATLIETYLVPVA